MPDSPKVDPSHDDNIGASYSGERISLPVDVEFLAEEIPQLTHQLQGRLGQKNWQNQKAWVGIAEDVFTRYQVANADIPLYKLQLVYAQLRMMSSVLDVVDAVTSYAEDKQIGNTPIVQTMRSKALTDAAQVLRPVLTPALKIIDVACNTTTEVITAAVGGVIHHDIFRPLQKKLTNLIDSWTEEFNFPENILGSPDMTIINFLDEIRDLLSFLAMLIVAHLDKVTTTDLAETFKYTGKTVQAEQITIGSIGLAASIHTLILNALDYSDEVIIRKGFINSADIERTATVIPLVPPAKSSAVVVNAQAIEITNLVSADRAKRLLDVVAYYLQEMQSAENYMPGHGLETAALEAFTVVRVTEKDKDLYEVSIKISVVPYPAS